MKITSEQQLLSESLRAEIIKNEIYSDENRERKAQMLRRHEIMKGKSKKWVMFGVEQEGFRPETIEQMRSRGTNISVGRKIVNKLSQTYVGGVERKIGEPIKQGDVVISNPDQVALDSLYDELDFNTNMKKVDRFRTGFRNTLAGVVPVKNIDASRVAGSDKYDLKMQVLAAWKYDVIEDPYDKTKPLAIIISEFTERLHFKTISAETLSDGSQGIRRQSTLSANLSDGKDVAIADASEDAEQEQSSRRFIWWTASYHFTTDIRGRIVQDASPTDGLNPIKRLPYETFAGDQDGSYWADGGDDIFETDILINKKLTDANFIQFVQGWGQLVIDAEGDIPKKLIGGPDNAWIFERRSGAAPAVVTYATSNPPIENWLETIRMILALCLSTNDLSTRNIAAKLDVVTAPSGILMMIENADLLVDVKDSQVYFQDKEPCLLEIVAAWHKVYATNNWLTENFQSITPLTNTDMTLKFHELKAPISKKEELEEIKLEKDLGVVTMIDMLRKLNPDLTEDEASKKAEQLIEEKKKMSSFVTDAASQLQKKGLKPGEEQPNDEEGDEELS